MRPPLADMIWVPIPEGVEQDWNDWLRKDPVILIDASCSAVQEWLSSIPREIRLAVIDCGACTTAKDFFATSRRGFLGEFETDDPYGMNWSAFAEYTFDLEFYDDKQIVVVWCGFGCLSESNQSVAARAVEVLREVSKERHEERASQSIENRCEKSIAYLFAWS